MLVVFRFSFSLLLPFILMSHVLVCLRVCYVILICSNCVYVCHVEVEDHFWTEFAIDMDDRMHTLFDAW